MEYNGEFNPWPDETSMPKLSAEVYLDGDFYLTVGEKKLLAQVEEVYDKIVVVLNIGGVIDLSWICLLYTSPSPRDGLLSRMPSSA